MFVGAQVVNPKLLCPRFFSGGFAVEEEDVGLDALGVEDAGGQREQGVNVGLFEQLSPYGFAGAFEEDVVRNNDRGAAMLLQDGENVLEELHTGALQRRRRNQKPVVKTSNAMSLAVVELIGYRVNKRSDIIKGLEPDRLHAHRFKKLPII
jgi:hypothetical protein